MRSELLELAFEHALITQDPKVRRSHQNASVAAGGAARDLPEWRELVPEDFMRAIPVPLEREVVELRVRLPVVAGTHGLERVARVVVIT
jgi:hypothetical protein